jgi:hypothetical protein
MIITVHFLFSFSQVTAACRIEGATVHVSSPRRLPRPLVRACSAPLIEHGPLHRVILPIYLSMIDLALCLTPSEACE